MSIFKERPLSAQLVGKTRQAERHPPGTSGRCLGTSVSWGCCNKCNRMDGLNNRHFFSQFQKPGSPRPRCQPGQALGRPLFWAGRRPPSHCVFTWSRGKTLPFLVCLAAQSHPTLCGPVDCSPPGSSVHGTLQARILFSSVQSLSRVQLSVALWTVAHQAPLSMGFSRQE